MTKELIEEARRWPNPVGPVPSAAPGDLIPRLTDALDRATRCSCPSGDGSLRWPCPKHPPTPPAFDARAARQPTEDDREALALADELERMMKTAQWMSAAYGIRAVGLLRKLAGSSRAAVPDAATELQAHSDAELLRMMRNNFKHAEAERDDALAAVERVRALHPRGETAHAPAEGEVTTEDDLITDGCQGCQVPWPCPTVAALDGVPESEWEWAVQVPGDDEPFSDIYQSREHLAAQEDGISWGQERLVRRRKAGPWLPVEGESKP